MLPIFIAMALSAFRSPTNEKFVTVMVDDQVLNFKTTENFVAGALDRAGVKVGPNDILLPPTLAAIGNNELITIKRVERKRVAREIPIPHETRILENNRLRVNSDIELRAGIPGLRKEIVDLETVDGVTTEHLVSSTVLVEPVERKIYRGTRKTSATTGKVLHLSATAYTAGAESCWPYVDGKTALMQKAGYGVVAVDPKVIPLGTHLYVEGYGFAIASDIGGAITGNKIDLFMSNLETARAFGRRAVKVQFLD